MGGRLAPWGSCLAVGWALCLSAVGQPGQPDTGAMHQHYSAAQRYQGAGQLDQAAQEYHAFLADALGELALYYALAPDYGHAAPLFDEALALRPDSPSLLVAYARAAVTLGDPDHAKTLAREILNRYPHDAQRAADAHQILGRVALQRDQDAVARKEFETAVDLDATFPNGYDLAVACLDLEDDHCATQIFGEMERSFGDTPEIHMAFGRAYADSDFQPRAITEFRKALAENPKAPRAHYLLASMLMATGDDQQHVNEAEAELKKEVAVFPRDAEAYSSLGEIAATRHENAQAEAYLRKSIALDGQNPDAYLYLGQMYFGAGQKKEAESAVRACIRLTTDASRNRYQVRKAHFLLGRILMQEGQAQAAHAEMQTVQELTNRALSRDKSRLAALLNTSGGMEPEASAGDATPARGPASANASETMRKAEEFRQQIEPAVADSYNNLGAIAASRNDYVAALTWFTRAAEWNPQLEGLDYNWGHAAFAASRFAEAVPHLSHFLQGHPENAAVRTALAISQFMTDDYAGCVATARPLADPSAAVPQLQYVYAQSLVKTGRTAEGMERLQSLEKAHPEIPDVHRALGEALEADGKKQQAMEELRSALQLNAQDSEAHFALGKIELESGEATAAIPDLATATQLAPGEPAYREELAAACQAVASPEDRERVRSACAGVGSAASP